MFKGIWLNQNNPCPSQSFLTQFSTKVTILINLHAQYTLISKTQYLFYAKTNLIPASHISCAPPPPPWQIWPQICTNHNNWVQVSQSCLPYSKTEANVSFCHVSNKTNTCSVITMPKTWNDKYSKPPKLFLLANGKAFYALFLVKCVYSRTMLKIRLRTRSNLWSYVLNLISVVSILRSSDQCTQFKV